MNDKPWALVTGASSGLGELFAREYAKRGYNVVLCARRRERLQTLSDELCEKHAVQTHILAADLSESGAAARIKSDLDEHRIRIDRLINNAGAGLHGSFLDSDADAVSRMLQLDIVALTELTHVFGKDMALRGRGRILLVSSLLGYQATPGYAAYAAAKAYVLLLGEALHEEFAAHGVSVTVLSPGLTATEFVASANQPMSGLLRSMQMAPEPVVQAGVEALEAGRASVVAGLMNKLSAQSNRFTPRVMQRRMMRKIMQG